MIEVKDNPLYEVLDDETLEGLRRVADKFADFVQRRVPAGYEECVPGFKDVLMLYDDLNLVIGVRHEKAHAEDE